MSSEYSKYVIVVRHAKSSWKETYLQDHDRPLNKRGLRDAPIMAQYLTDKIDFSSGIILSSTARRAKDTSEYFKGEFDVVDERNLLFSELYHATSKNIQELISKQNAGFDTVMLFAHNPGVTDFVNNMSGEEIDNIPTCGVAVIKFDISTWSEIKTEKGKLEHYYYPKGI